MSKKICLERKLKVVFWVGGKQIVFHCGLNSEHAVGEALSSSIEAAAASSPLAGMYRKVQLSLALALCLLLPSSNEAAAAVALLVWPSL
jgi:hypothetical protein